MFLIMGFKFLCIIYNMVHSRRTRHHKRKMSGGGYLMPSLVSAGNSIGGYIDSQTNVGSGMSSGPAPNVALAQSGGRSRKLRRRRHRGHRGGGMASLTPEVLAPIGEVPVGGQKGGYLTQLMQAAVVPFGLMGLNHYAHKYSGKTAYMGKSRLSKRLSARRHGREPY